MFFLGDPMSRSKPSVENSGIPKHNLQRMVQRLDAPWHQLSHGFENPKVMAFVKGENPEFMDMLLELSVVHNLSGISMTRIRHCRRTLTNM